MAYVSPALYVIHVDLSVGASPFVAMKISPPSIASTVTSISPSGVLFVATYEIPFLIYSTSLILKYLMFPASSCMLASKLYFPFAPFTSAKFITAS